MSIKLTVCAAFLTALSTGAFAQDVVVTTDAAIDCTDEANFENEACLALPDDAVDITNFVPIGGALLGAGALAGLGGSTSSTTNTTSTTSTTD